ncbi:glycyl-tRNA synthetase subunit beta, partial [Candidatus Magnetoovum chiemensis]
MDNMQINNDKTISLLLEIGTEEIPAGFLPNALQDLRIKTKEHFLNHGITYSEINTFATPRRLTMTAEGVNAYKPAITEELIGPPRKAAYDAQGKPTKALVGFANSQGVSLESIKVVKTQKGEYIAAVIVQPGQMVKNIISEIFKSIIFSIQFPKSMRWASLNDRFARPIRWITALCDGESVSFKPLSGSDIISSNETYGHRLLTEGEIRVNSIDEYFTKLRENYVIANQEERRNIITSELQELAKQSGSIPVEDDKLIEHVTNLVEYPKAALCSFSSDFLSLPKELLVSVMRDHQKFFALENEAGTVVNNFIVISNTIKENEENVRKGAQKVIKARLEDAKFYFDDDRKKPLSKRVEGLKGVVYHRSLGTLYDKTNRLEQLSAYLSKRLFGEGSEKETNETVYAKSQRAAKLCKADLISGVVREFPELQGLMGKYYALNDNEDQEVAAAIFEHYLPLYSGGRLPNTNTGTVLSLCDKLDAIVSFFSVGLIPSGSEDPFALRRGALGIVAILINRKFDITLQEIFYNTCVLLKKDVSLMDKISLFLRQRIEALFASMGYSSDTIAACCDNFMEIPAVYMINRLKAVKELT